MSLRVCAQPGCPELVNKGTRDGRCPPHRREADRARGTRQQRGYDATYDRAHRDYQHRMNAGEQFNCWRCGLRIDPTAWTLGHDDHDRDILRGPECPTCQYATAGRRISPHA